MRWPSSVSVWPPLLVVIPGHLSDAHLVTRYTDRGALTQSIDISPHWNKYKKTYSPHNALRVAGSVPGSAVTWWGVAHAHPSCWARAHAQLMAGRQYCIVGQVSGDLPLGERPINKLDIGQGTLRLRWTLEVATGTQRERGSGQMSCLNVKQEIKFLAHTWQLHPSLTCFHENWRVTSNIR